jgi:hypothetical protein
MTQNIIFLDSDDNDLMLREQFKHEALVPVFGKRQFHVEFLPNFPEYISKNFAGTAPEILIL